MPTTQQTKEDVMGKINGIIAALNKYPELKTTNTQLSFSFSANPIDMLVDFFKTTMGYDYVIEKVSGYIASELPALELVVKGVLLSNIRIMLSCSINPLITENMIKNGVVFNLNEIDLLNIFNYSPLNKSIDNPGRYYYFGCNPEDGIEILDDLKNSRDFNAFLWYSKNTPGERIAWRREIDVPKPIVLSPTGKQVKSNGVVTVEFNGRASGLTNAEGDKFFIQEPIDNCVHVFIGNCTPKVQDETIEADIRECTQKIKKCEDLLEESDKYKGIVSEYRRNAKTQAIDRGASAEELNKIDVEAEMDLYELKRLDGAIVGYDIDFHEHGKNIDDIFPWGTVELNSIHETITIPGIIMGTNEVKEKKYKTDLMQNTVEKEYYPATNNYYYKRFLFEWNTDFVMSMKIFDEKVVTAQLIDALTNLFNFSGSVSLTPQMQFAKSQIKDLVTKIIKTDDGTVSDCFFSFTNETYNNLLNEVELNRVNLKSTSGNDINNIPSPESVMEALNGLSQDATQEELKSAISGSIFSAASASTPNKYGQDGNLSLDLNVNMNIIDQLITNLVYVIVLTIMQPKIYILLMMNLKLLGEEPNFDLKKFIQQFKDLISQLIKTIRDEVLEFFRKELLKILQELVKTLAIRLTLEQYQYYVTLITHCIECLKIHRNQFDWLQDDVNYADITELNQLENQEC